MQRRTSRQGQGLERGLAVEFAVAIAAVVFVLEGQRPFLQLIFCSHGNSAQELLLIVMIELFHYPIAPRLRLGDEPQLYPIMEAKPNERPHTPWMSGTAVEHHFVVYLEMPRDPEPAPDRPKGLIDRSSTPTEQGLRAASACAQINDIHTVEPERSIITSEISRTHEIGLVPSIGCLRRESGILCPFGFIAPRTPMGEVMMVQGAIDGP